MLSVGDLVWYQDSFTSVAKKEWGVGVVTRVIKKKGCGTRYYVHWQQPENYRWLMHKYYFTNELAKVKLPKQ